MKKKALVFISAFLMLTIQSQAQLGLHLGYNFAKVSGVQVPSGMSEENLSNLSGGLFFDKDLIPLLDLRIGLMYSPKGTHFTQGGDYEKMDYLVLFVRYDDRFGQLHQWVSH